jgi:trk system potassium uptake protein TrkA
VRTIILGAGSSGLQLAKRLSEEGKDVVLIERDHDVARVAANALDCLVVQGDGSLPETIERAGVGKADHFVALTGSDEMNIVTCSVIAAEYPRVKRVARVRNSYFTKLEPSRRSFMGVDRFVNPDIETARSVLALATQGIDEGLIRFSDEDLVLRSSRLTAASPFAGRSLRESRIALGRDFLAAALERGSGIEVPSGDTVPDEGDIIYLLGAPMDLDALLGHAFSPASTYRKIIVAGGNAIGRFIAEGFLGHSESKDLRLTDKSNRFFRYPKRQDLVIVERSMEVCKVLARDLPNALVLNRDLSDEDVFLEEGLGGSDLFLAVTSNQELNLLSAARAKAFGVQKVVSLSENNAYTPFAADLGVDTVISVKSNFVSSIIEYLRGGNLTTLYSFFDRGLKILEFTVPERSELDYHTIRELKLPRAALVIFVNRRGRSSLPTGDTRLAAGDRIGIFTSMDAIRGVEELFLGSGT